MTWRARAAARMVFVVMMAICLTTTFGVAKSQTRLLTFRTSYSDVDLREATKVFVTSGGNYAEVIRDKFAGTGGIGAEFTQITESGRFEVTFGAEYKTSNLFGSGGFRILYSPELT